MGKLSSKDRPIGSYRIYLHFSAIKNRENTHTMYSSDNPKPTRRVIPVYCLFGYTPGLELSYGSGLSRYRKMNVVDSTMSTPARGGEEDRDKVVSIRR
jgi:hypothetical protein